MALWGTIEQEGLRGQMDEGQLAQGCKKSLTVNGQHLTKTSLGEGTIRFVEERSQ